MVAPDINFVYAAFEFLVSPFNAFPELNEFIDSDTSEPKATRAFL
jgi:hypothetical protein